MQHAPAAGCLMAALAAVALHVALDWDIILQIKRGIFARKQGV